jgi:hypothetical protein
MRWLYISDLKTSPEEAEAAAEESTSVKDLIDKSHK